MHRCSKFVLPKRIVVAAVMARINLTLPDELHDQALRDHPGLNFSEVLREGLWARLSCDHAELYCRTCHSPISPAAVAEDQLRLFWLDELDELERAVVADFTAEGTARVLKRVAVRHHLEPGPMPRRTRAEREAPDIAEVA